MSNNILSINNLSYTYPSGEEIFHNLNLEISEGKFYVLLGKNGSGKSTLINLLLGLRHPLEGEISIFGMNPVSANTEILQKMFFNSHDLMFDPSSRVGFILDNYSLMYANYDKEREKELLEIFRLDRNKYVSQLSTGMKVRIQFIAAISSQVPFLLMDEVTAVLDRDARIKLNSVLREECAKGRSVLMATNIPEDTEFDDVHVITINNLEVQNEAA